MDGLFAHTIMACLTSANVLTLVLSQPPRPHRIDPGRLPLLAPSGHRRPAAVKLPVGGCRGGQRTAAVQRTRWQRLLPHPIRTVTASKTSASSIMSGPTRLLLIRVRASCRTIRPRAYLDPRLNTRLVCRARPTPLPMLSSESSTAPSSPCATFEQPPHQQESPNFLWTSRKDAECHSHPD
ncbi:hypothetical protein FA95DRAFT_1043319 [Auriscalpium vulgare]|uniref:Uncharacterized protein n=1 Tax=Auriscalpium vulgare TaxID=40419 RepID=A0ACB8R5E1_9AGAM|nr:hypothetical protein FA95DRAFT_1043319 [Auriscalpium vulgare]